MAKYSPIFAPPILFMTRLIAFFLLAFAVLHPPITLGQKETASLIANGTFEASADGVKPDDWALGEGASWGKEGDNHFLRLVSPRPGANVTVYRAVNLAPEVKALELSYKVRHEGIKKGKQSWFDGRIMMNFKVSAKHVI